MRVSDFSALGTRGTVGRMMTRRGFVVLAGATAVASGVGIGRARAAVWRGGVGERGRRRGLTGMPRRGVVPSAPAPAAHGGGAGLTLAQLWGAETTRSANPAGNLLLEAIGGPAGLTQFARTLGD